MCSLFGSSKNTSTDMTTDQTSHGTADYSNEGTSSVTPTLDPSIAPTMPLIGGGLQGAFGPNGSLQSVADASSFAQGQAGNSMRGLDTRAQQGAGMIEGAVADNPTINAATSTLLSDPNIKYNGSGVPDAVSGGAARDVGANGVTGSQILGNMSPYLSGVVGSTSDLMHKNNAVQLAQLAAKQAGNKAFGDRSGLAESDLMYNQGLTYNNTISSLMQQGYTQAQAQAEADAQRAQVGEQSNQQSDLNLQQRIAAASAQNQQAGLTKAQADLAAQAQEAQLRQSGATGAANIAAGQQALKLNAGNSITSNAIADVGARTALGNANLTAAGAPIQALGSVADIAYGAPQGQKGTQSSTGTATQDTNSTTHQVGTGSTSSNPSILQDAAGVAGLVSALKDGGRVGYADGGAFDDNPAVQDWRAGRVHSSDMGAPEDAPIALPVADQLGMDASAMRFAPPRAAAAPAPKSGGAFDDFRGALDRFANRMADSPFSQAMEGITNSGEVPFSIGVKGVQAARAQKSALGLEDAQTSQLQESTRQSREYFNLLKALRDNNSDDGLSGGPAPPPIGGSSPVGGGPGRPPQSVAAVPIDPATGQPTGGNAQSMTIPFTAQRMFNEWRKIRYVPQMKEQATEMLKMIGKELPENMTLDPGTGTFQFVPGYVGAQAGLEKAKSDAVLPNKVIEGLAQRAGTPVAVGENQTVTTGAAALGLDKYLNMAMGNRNPNMTPIPGKITGPGSARPAPGAAKEPKPAVDPDTAAAAPTDATTPLTRNSDGSMSSFWNPATKKGVDDFLTAKDKAIEEAQNAQESDNNIGRMEQAFKEMKAKGMNTGYFTPGLAQVTAMAKSLGLDTTLSGIKDKDGKPIFNPEAVSDAQTADKSSKYLMGKILKQMYPQRITNVDITVNKGIAPGMGIDEAANQNLIDSLKRQNGYDKNFANEILSVDQTNPRAMLKFQPEFYKKYGFGPLAGTYFTQKGGKIQPRSFSTTAPSGMPPGTVDTGQLMNDPRYPDKKGWKIYQKPDGTKTAAPPE